MGGGRRKGVRHEDHDHLLLTKKVPHAHLTGEVDILTGGGPGTSTETLSFLNYQTFIVNTDFGYGGAISVMLVVIALVVSAGYVRLLRPETS